MAKMSIPLPDRDALIVEMRQHRKHNVAILRMDNDFDRWYYQGMVDMFDFVERYLAEHTEWKCQHCRTANPGDYNVCQYCKHDKPAAEIDRLQRAAARKEQA
jgi:hypothetical protein